MTRVLLALVLVAGIAGGAGWWLAPRQPDPQAETHVAVSTTRVVRTSLATTTQMSGTLGHAGSYTVAVQRSGTVSALPAPGDVIERGGRLFEVDGTPVTLLYGSRPAWRDFAAGMTPGPDVRELEQNLAALGYGRDLAVDEQFTRHTVEAVLAWQRATRRPATGTVGIGAVAFWPGPVRVLSVAAPLGAVAQAGQPVLSASTPDPVVTVPVPAVQSYLVHRGDRGTVTFPAGTRTTGRVAEVSPIASISTEGGDRSAPPEATVSALVRLDRPSTAAGLDQAPVTVEVTDRRVSNVLAVPVTALVALAGGGFGVWVDNGGRRLVAVTPGLFANTLVQVTAPNLHQGELVEVPVP
jgi:peptidoglycan hydrolase-like protein with peptidoglycan-binding domain